MLLDCDINTLTSTELATLFGITENELIIYCSSVISKTDLRYRWIENKERDQLLLQVIKRIYSGELAKSGKGRQPDWEQGWKENLDEFLMSGYDLGRLIPKYFKNNAPARLNLEYIMPVSENFVFSYTHVYRTWIFQKYFKEVENIYEFGCGPAYHLAYLAQMYPGKRLFGLDWTASSQEIIGHLSQHFGWKIAGQHFDFFKPDPQLTIEKNSGILTFGALEQIGDKYGPFIEFLLKNKPSICVNVECLNELYDPDNLLSYLALQYHQKRNYLSGYLSTLQRLEKEQRIEIIKFHYHRFGNLFDDPLSYVIWKPK